MNRFLVEITKININSHLLARLWSIGFLYLFRFRFLCDGAYKNLNSINIKNFTVVPTSNSPFRSARRKLLD